MIYSVRYTCVLDTNVIYPIEIRDILFWFAFYELFTPKWSAHIVTNNVKDFPKEYLARFGLTTKTADDLLPTP